VGAAALRLFGLGDEGFWFDEFCIWRQMHLDFDALLNDLIFHDVHPPLYPVLAWGWSLGIGTSEIALRLPSVLFGVLAVLAVHGLARELLEERIAWLATGLFVINSHAVYYSQEARSYALLLLLSASTAWAFIRCLRDPGHRPLVYFILLGSLLAWTHVFGILFLGFLGVVWLIFRAQGNVGAFTDRRWWIGSGAIALLFAPWMPALLVQVTRVSEGFWIPRPTLGTLAWFLRHYTGGISLAIAAAALLVFLAVSLWREQGDDDSSSEPLANERSAVLFLGGWIVAIVGVPFLVSQFMQPILHHKSAVSAVVPLCLLLAVALCRLPWRLQWPAVGAWFVFAALALGWGVYGAQNREEWKGMSDHVSSEFDAATDLVVLHHPSFDYGYCYRHYLDPATQPIDLLCEGSQCVAKVRAIEAVADAQGATRIWLMKMRASDEFPESLDERWQVTQQRTYINGVLERLARRESTP
jgi:uncharacterized membrane protein